MSRSGMRGGKSSIRSFIRQQLWSIPCLLLATGPLLAAEEAAKALEREYEFKIAAQSVNSALAELAKQADVQLMFAAGEAGNRPSPGVTGKATVAQALERVLQGTDLVYDVQGENTVAVKPANTLRDARGQQLASSLEKTAIRLAQNSPQATAGTGASGGDQSEVARLGEVVELEEIVVTGSLIRGATPITPVITLDRVDIERAGVSTLAEALQRLPQNFGGGANPGTNAAPGRDGDFNIGFGASVNLRGLGSNATLVLINGRRVALSGSGTFVDISTIPLSAIERVEILPDGASAIYGSDSIAGVVNVILREDFEGFETTVRYGQVTDGDLGEVRATQLLGTTWAGGNALFSYEYHDRDNLEAVDREFSSANAPADLLPSKKHHYFYGFVKQDLSESVKGELSVLVSRNDTNYRFNPAIFGDIESDSTSDQIDVGGEILISLPSDLTLEISPQFSQNELDLNFSSMVSPLTQKDEFRSVGGDVRLNGRLWALPAGNIRFATGVSYRNEAFEQNRIAGAGGSATNRRIDESRDIAAVYAELQVPLVSDKNPVAFAREFTLSLAGRYEDYSDFGSSTNPKVGLLWSPVDSVRIRGSYGRSFKAPLFVDLYGAAPAVFAFDPSVFGVPDPGSPTGSSLVLAVTGSNPGLRAEKATHWSGSIEWSPASNDSLARISYFDVDFEDRIDVPTDFLFDPFLSFPQFESTIDRTPSLADVNALLAIPGLQNFFGPFTPDQVTAIFDDRIQNLSQLRVQGIDGELAKRFELNSSMALSVGLNASYILSYEQRFTAGAVPQDMVNRIFNPAQFRARGRVGLQTGAIESELYINYTDSYLNDTVVPTQEVGSWTTVDVSIQYNFDGGSAGLLQGTTLSLSGINILDRNPPFVTSANLTDPIGYDPTLADPTGRYIALQIRKGW